jgi:hypothetical protein
VPSIRRRYPVEQKVTGRRAPVRQEE